MQVNVKKNINRGSLPTEVLAADYKARGFKRHVAWDKLIIERGLRPGINAKEFYAIFDSVAPVLLSVESNQVDFRPTHTDTLRCNQVMISQRDDGVFVLVWQDGSSGTNPPCYPPEADRFVPLNPA